MKISWKHDRMSDSCSSPKLLVAWVAPAEGPTAMRALKLTISDGRRIPIAVVTLPLPLYHYHTALVRNGNIFTPSRIINIWQRCANFLTLALDQWEQSIRSRGNSRPMGGPRATAGLQCRVSSNWCQIVVENVAQIWHRTVITLLH